MASVTTWLKQNTALNGGVQTAELAISPRRPLSAAALRPLTRDGAVQAMSAPDAQAAYAAMSQKFDALGLIDIADAANQGDRRALFQLVHALVPHKVLEIGTCNGASTAFIAAALRAQTDESSRPRLTTVDLIDVNDPAQGIWKLSGLPYPPRGLLNRLGLEHLVSFVAGGAEPFFAQSDERFDFVFIDGSHRAANVYADISGALAHLSDNGVILLHDFYPQAKPLWRSENAIPGVFIGVQRALSECSDLAVAPLGELPWTTKHGGCVTSLALLTRRAH
jgi:predicted O-methyltransferase YrrM